MTNKIIYFDESGNTGQDMLNADQKVFVLASVNYNIEQLNQLKSIFDNNHEVHFKNLKNSSNGRKKIIEFLNHELIKEDHIIFYVVHKEFNICGQITDQLIETVIHKNGFDLYKHGKHIAFSNWIYYFGNFFWNKNLYNDLIENFVLMIRNKSKESITQFYLTANELYNSVKEKQIIKPIIESEKQIDSVSRSWNLNYLIKK